ncbi:MAG: hypothetical protein ABR988_17535 [Terriglobales bacterium]
MKRNVKREAAGKRHGFGNFEQCYHPRSRCFENDDTKNSQDNTPDDILPIAPKKQTRKERSKASPTSDKSSKQQKHSLWRNWNEASRTRQVELVFLGLVAIGGVGYLVAYICISIWQGRQAKTIAQMEHAPLVIHPRPPQLLMPFTCDTKKNSLTTGNMQSFVRNIGNATAEGVNPFFGMQKIIPEKKRRNALSRMPGAKSVMVLTGYL